ncbi:MAG: carboxylesterase family protein [Pseudomonadota bacterium]
MKTDRRSFLSVAAGALAGGGCAVGGDQSSLESHGENPPGERFAVSTDAQIVPIQGGRVQGYVRGGIHIYKGVPYGGTTGGSFRFLPAGPVSPWEGVRRAMTYGPVCPAGEPPPVDLSANEWPFLLPNGPVTSAMEDCLRINIWSPAPDPEARLPVMLWLHADGFGGGSSQDFLSTDGEALARQENVVVASINHRVGPLGFTNLASVDETLADSGNVGMLDVVTALNWVQQHIAGFGGDPGNVTVFGQSGGGFKISVLLAMPAARGLFHRAIIQSGARIRVHDETTSAALGDALVSSLKLKKDADPLAALQSLSLEAFFEAAQAASAQIQAAGEKPKRWQSPPWWYEPTAGLPSLPVQPFDPQAPQVSAQVPVICGSTLNELPPSMNAPEVEDITWDDLQARLAPQLADQTEAAISAARAIDVRWTPADVLSVFSSRRFRVPAVTLADRLAERPGASVWQYLFSWQTPLYDGRPRAFHTSDVAFVFANTDLVDSQTGGGDRPRRLAKTVSRAWANFARTGNPNGPGVPYWPAYIGADRNTMIFDDESAARPAPDVDLLDIFRQLDS